ncbi:MAG TPA: ComEA family DNA-binding protein [bacterium]|nr:ComEA family DNA-binding protein [bacterium]
MKFKNSQKVLIIFLIIINGILAYIINSVFIPGEELKKYEIKIIKDGKSEVQQTKEEEEVDTTFIILNYSPITPLTPEEKEALIDELRININTATIDDLVKLKGIGPSTAETIIAFREKNGPFASFEDLAKVPGLGEKKIAKFKDKITFGKIDKKILKEKLAITADGKINLNLATEEDLVKVEGIGPGTAKKIIKYREEHKKFKSVEELREVPGIGQKKFEQISKYLTVTRGGLTKEDYLKRKDRAEKEKEKKEKIKESSGLSEKKKSKKGDKININNATVEELTTLPKIGPSAAKRIIEYRKENGRFRRIEDIMNVPGIGIATFERIKDEISVR